MSDNPYRSPTAESSETGDDRLRRRAESAFRLSTCILIVPALYNYWQFDSQAIASSALPSAAMTTYRTTNLACFVVGGTLIWFFGVRLLEWLSGKLRNVVAQRADPDAWHRVLYENLARTPAFAIAGACLWAIWVYGFYVMSWNFMVISWAVGVPSHLLAACIYLPLAYRWYRLATAPDEIEMARGGERQ